MGNSKAHLTMMKLTILVVLIAATFAQKVAKAHPSCKLAISKNGRCGKAFGNTRCAGGFCSKWNWCGTSALHKRTHQAKYDGRNCGKRVVKKTLKLKLKVKKAKKAKKVVKKAKKAKKAKKVMKKKIAKKAKKV